MTWNPGVIMDPISPGQMNAIVRGHGELIRSILNEGNRLCVAAEQAVLADNPAAGQALAAIASARYDNARTLVQMATEKMWVAGPLESREI